MPPHGRREGIRIVGPLDVGREKELVGGLKNAIERGESIGKAKQTFINAGYTLTEVNAAVLKIPEGTAQIITPTTGAPAPSKTPESSKTPAPKPGAIPAKPLPGAVAQSGVAPKKTSKTIIIIIIVLSALVLIGAGILGWKWEFFFGG